MSGLTNTVAEVAALGAVTPIGASLGEFWAGAISGRCGIVRDGELADAGLSSQVVARVDTEQVVTAPYWRDYWREYPRYIQLALAAAAEAWHKVSESHRVGSRIGLVYSTAMGAVDHHAFGCSLSDTNEIVEPHYSVLGEVIANELDIAGPTIGVSDGCTGGLDGFITACELIENEEVDVCLAVCSDAPLSTLTLAAMDNLGVLSHRNEEPKSSCRPFDSDRDGMVMAEGAAAIVLTGRKRTMGSSVNAIAIVEAHSSVSNCRSMVSLKEASDDMARCIKNALERGRLSPGDIDHFNVHGSGTEQNDAAEGVALRAVFGERVRQMPAVAIKSLTGHALAASNGIELAAEVMSLRTGLLPPAKGNGSINPWGIKLVTQSALTFPAIRGLKLNHGFGGFHSCVVLSRS